MRVSKKIFRRILFIALALLVRSERNAFAATKYNYFIYYDASLYTTATGCTPFQSLSNTVSSCSAGCAVIGMVVDSAGNCATAQCSCVCKSSSWPACKRCSTFSSSESCSGGICTTTYTDVITDCNFGATPASTKRCDTGYYGNGTTCTNCTTTQSSATTAGRGSTVITQCYIPANITIAESGIGDYLFTNNCFYS
ncbi:MAG: hypothetical protein LBJ18_04490 [Rickettsiales bacterium]|nr:hypothetical protein [Rickettsiales bacterium]